ncbi:hypothetical protein DPMN_058921 [Dreissena polymorpha]|uniref:Uncharacterized protein n=1 Tax=Dreissena polymorpha TaxID=45954 RepID=A0A9D4C2M1_DREPO|nr:hypothetical protein DPMN_058921 [Dreissena polymorpha]
MQVRPYICACECKLGADQQILIIIKPECGRVPVNPEQATVYPGEAPAEPRLSPVMPRWSPGKAGSVPAKPRSTVTPPSLTGAILATDPGRATATPRFNRGRRR